MPDFPREYIPYLRMRVDRLTPREYWQTSQYDIDMALAVQHAYGEGRDEAIAEGKREDEQDAEREKQEREALERLKAGR